MIFASHLTESGKTTGELAAALGVNHELAWLWQQSCRRIPAEQVLLIEAVTTISKHILRPDIHRPPTPKHCSKREPHEPAKPPAVAAE